MVINTRNDASDVGRCLKSVRWADEIIVIDQESTDGSAEVAEAAGARVYKHKPSLFVELVRNFAISKATGDWVLILDPDEEIPSKLAEKIRKIADSDGNISFYRFPRKNIIFGKWIKHSLWWPDYLIRFFRKGSVVWSEKIHSIPETRGIGQDLTAEEENAITHYNYRTISQYLEKMGRYTDAQAKELVDSGYIFNWKDLISKPTAEFLRRFFSAEGYRGGVHCLALSLLQAFSELVIYLKVWEQKKFPDDYVDSRALDRSINDIIHWQAASSSGIRKILLRIKARL